jgi:hypothetical protein
MIHQTKIGDAIPHVIRNDGGGHKVVEHCPSIELAENMFTESNRLAFMLTHVGQSNPAA